MYQETSSGDEANVLSCALYFNCWYFYNKVINRLIQWLYLLAEVMKTLLKVTFCGKENPRRASQEQTYMISWTSVKVSTLSAFFGPIAIVLCSFSISHRWKMQLHTSRCPNIFLQELINSHL